MATMLKQTLAVVAAALFAGAVYAADVELKEGHPDRYVVVKGDTLWDISARFLNSPWLWPEVWQANPQIQNPHLIYPGDVISLVYIDGKPMLTLSRDPGASGITGPRVRVSELDDAITTIPLSKVQQYLRRPRLLDREELETAPYLVAMEENRIMGMNTQVAYARQLDAPVGTRFAIVAPSMVYRDLPKKWFWDKERRQQADPWELEEFKRRSFGKAMNYLWYDWAYSRNTELLGYEVMEVGTAEVVAEGDPATVHISYVDREIKKGHLLLPELARPFDLNFYPHGPGEVPEGMRVLALNEALGGAGISQVVVFNRGTEDGIDNGTVVSLHQPGERIRDEIKAPRGDIRYTFGLGDDKVTLPAEFTGHAMVFRTFDRISYGLIMDAVKPVNIGDIARQPLD